MYQIRGKVRRGKQRGKTLGFPTANIHLHQEIPDGIYFSEVVIGSTKYPALTFIGAPETFEEAQKTCETYILNFAQDIYDQLISLRILKKLRNNQKFTSEGDLINQMISDKKKAEKYFKLI